MSRACPGRQRPHRDRDRRRHCRERGDLCAPLAAHAYGLGAGETAGAYEPRDGAGRFPPDGGEPRSHGRSRRHPGSAARGLRAGRGRARYLGRDDRQERGTAAETRARLDAMTTLSDAGFLAVGGQRLEYRMIGPRPDRAPTIMMLHEGLGSAAMWGDFPDRLASATGAGIFVYSRAGYGQSSPVTLPRPLGYMHEEARETLPQLLSAIGFKRGLLLGHSDGASIATIYAGS